MLIGNTASQLKVIDDFIKNEELKMTWLDKLIMNYPKVRLTKSIADSFQNIQLGKEKVIKPSIWEKIVPAIFFLFAGLFWIGLLKALLENTLPFPVNLSGLIFVTFLIFLLFKNSFLNNKYIYTITVDYEGIRIDNNKFYWTDIAETCIMSRHEGRRTNYYLLIFKRDATIEKCDLYKFGISDIKLSTIIEYYRAGRNNYTV